MTNLYRILRQHCGPKSSFEGIVCYLVAEDDEEVYKWLASEPTLYRPDRDGDYLNTNWNDQENEERVDYEIETKPEVYEYVDWKTWVLHHKGDYERDEDDFFYGADFFCWQFVKILCAEDFLLLEDMERLLGQDIIHAKKWLAEKGKEPEHESAI